MRIYSDREEFLESVRAREKKFGEAFSAAEKIVADVFARGEEALLEYSLRFDGLGASSVRDLAVDPEEIAAACVRVREDFLRSLRKASRNIAHFHRQQMKRRKGFTLKKGGLVTGERVLPVERAGVYVPGGSAAYPSSALMNVLPAREAGVSEVIAVTPPGEDGRVNDHTLAALAVAGVDRVYRLGGAHAVAALAFGTGIPRVNRIVGPGNPYVSAAKLLVQQRTNVGTDAPAGPTEVVVVADGRADAEFAAADLLAQAEHGGDSMPLLLTSSRVVAERTVAGIEKQIEGLERRDIAEKCLRENGACLVVRSVKEAIEVSDLIAPEHVGLHVSRPWEALEKIRNAGAVFLGGYSPESLGDYLAGPSHVLPTSGRAVYASPLGVDDFLKRMNFVCSDRDFLRGVSRDIIRLARAEGFSAHAGAVRIREEGLNGGVK